MKAKLQAAPVRQKTESEALVRISVPYDFRFRPARNPSQILSGVKLTAHTEATGKSVPIFSDASAETPNPEIILDRADKLPALFMRGHNKIRLSELNGTPIWEWRSREYFEKTNAS